MRVTGRFWALVGGIALGLFLLGAWTGNKLALR